MITGSTQHSGPEDEIDLFRTGEVFPALLNDSHALVCFPRKLPPIKASAVPHGDCLYATILQFRSSLVG
jgi:hypothetical protein